MEIKNYVERYYRNGIGGQGAWVARFQANPVDPYQFETFTATLWSSNGEEAPTECVVMRLVELGETPDENFDDITVWRATDHFLPELIPFHERWNEDEVWKARADARLERLLTTRR